MFEIVIFIHFACLISTSSEFNCILPKGCKIDNIYSRRSLFTYDLTIDENLKGLLCDDIRDKEFQFDFPMSMPTVDEISCLINTDEIYKDTIELRFHNDFILSEKFNIRNFLYYSMYFENPINANFVNLNGFELDIANGIYKDFLFLYQDIIDNVNCIKCKIEFYTTNNSRLVKTCQDIIDSNSIMVRSLFQFRLSKKVDSGNLLITLYDSQFKTTLCPLVFNNSHIAHLYISSLVDTFYKRNLLTIENRTFSGLKSYISNIAIKGENINIDSNLLNPSVFKALRAIRLIGSVNMIDGNSLNALNSFVTISFIKEYYRDMIHKNGIKWIRDLNSQLKVNLSNFKELISYYRILKNKRFICIDGFSYISEIRLSKLLPDEDFCLYKDFPFNQLVILMEYIYDDRMLAVLNSTRHYTCTYLWLTQYFHIFLRLNER